jgi:hypothetical protein
MVLQLVLGVDSEPPERSFRRLRGGLHARGRLPVLQAEPPENVGEEPRRLNDLAFHVGDRLLRVVIRLRWLRSWL